MSNYSPPMTLNTQKPDALGGFNFVLHSHIPYVLSHGRWPHGTDWLVEVAAETYVPLLEVFYRLIEEGISPQLTLGITPILTEQLADPGFHGEFIEYLDGRIASARRNLQEFQQSGNVHQLGIAYYWDAFYTGVKDVYENRYACDIVGAFRKLQEEGHLEIITSAATHGYLPLIGTDESVSAQIKQGIQTYEKHYGQKPSGFWLPECAYRPRYEWRPPVGAAPGEKPILRRGVEEFLAENGIEYFFVDAHLLKGGSSIGVYADRFAGLQALWKQFQKTYEPEKAERTPYAPYLVNSTDAPLEPVAIFSRDHVTGQQVWSGDTGYPGDPAYLEFHKKRYPENLRYWRVSENKEDLDSKALYEPHVAAQRLEVHAEHFVSLIAETLTEHRKAKGTPGFITALYDTELYGHWWFEGPEFLYLVLKKLHEHPQIDRLTCRDYLHANPPKTVVSLPEGSWGEGGYHWIWLNEWTVWTWEKIYKAEAEMISLADEYGDDVRVTTLLKQAARELLLLESSDWQFSISTFSSRDYAEQRVNFHFTRFTQIAELVRKVGRGEQVLPQEWDNLGEAEDRDRCFPDVDPNWWRKREAV